jgi:hypothetical protein
LELSDIFYDKDKMSSIFQLRRNKDRWLHNDQAVVTVVEQLCGGDIVYNDTNGNTASLLMNATVPIPTAVPAAVGANMGISRGTNVHLQTSGVGVIGFNLSFFKVAAVEEHVYMEGPIAILSRQPEYHEKLAEAVSWSKLGKLVIRDGSREALALTAGMTNLAHLITPLKHETTWAEGVRAGVQILRNTFPTLPLTATNSARQCVFSVTHDTIEVISGDQARAAVVTHLGSGNFGDVTMDEVPDTENAEKEAPKQKE